jgi:hypothetical protein
MRSFTKLGLCAAGLLFYGLSIASADDAIHNPRYSALPNLTDDQRAKIAAIEKHADEQVMEILTDEQKTAMAGKTVAPAAPGGGLYADDATGKTSGPIKSRDYWESKFNAEQLEQAIKDHQPEGAIALQLISSVNLVNDLLKKYPNHKELQDWKAREIAVQKQIGDNFNRGDVFKPGCLWSQESYMQAYVGYNTSKTALEDNDQDLVFAMSGLAKQKVDYLTESDDHMADYPEDAKAFIRKIKPELDEIHHTAAVKTHHI